MPRTTNILLPMRLLPALLLSLLIALQGGCAIPALISGMAESYRRSSTRSVPAEYTDLSGKDVAVVVVAPPQIEAANPGLVAHLTLKLSERLANPDHDTGITGIVPPADVLGYCYNHPGWTAMPISELAQELDNVRCIVYVELQEYRLNDPGNSYIWEGVAAGSVAVIDTHSGTPDDYVFERTVQVKFPDKPGLGPEAYSGEIVTSELSRRFLDRVSWLFYTHEEPYYPKY